MSNYRFQRIFYFIFFIIVTIVGCKDDAANLLAAGTDVYIGCWYNDNVFIFEGTDTHNGKHILDYNSAEGKAFAEFNKINYQDTNYDFKAKYRSMLALPELAAEYHPIERKNDVSDDIPAEEEVKPVERPTVTLDKTQLPTYSTRDKSKKANVGKKNIPADRMPNYDKIFGSGGSAAEQQSGQQSAPKAVNQPQPKPMNGKAAAKQQDQNIQNGKPAVPVKGQLADNSVETAGQQPSSVSTVRGSDRSKVQDTVNISEVQVGEIIMDATMDEEYRKRYIFDTRRIAELNGFRDELDNALMAELKSQFRSYGVRFTTDVTAVTDENTRLLFEIVKYRPGEFNLIKNISTNMTMQFRIVNPKYNVDTTFRGDFSCEASAYYPNEKSRLMEISRKIAEYLQMKISLIRVKNLKTVQREPIADETTDAGPPKPLPPGSADIPADEKIVPINEAIHKKGLKSAGRND